MLKNINLTILVAFSMVVTVFSARLSAEGKHEHSHAKANQQEQVEAHWTSPKEAAERTNPIKSDEDSIARGAKSYTTLCVSCHGEKALGDGVAGASLDPKPTNLKAMSGGHKDGDFAWKIANGRGAMAAWKTTLSENDIWDLVNFIQDLKNEGKSFQSEHNHNTHKH